MSIIRLVHRNPTLPGNDIWRFFAHDYPDDTAGIILLDPASPDLHPPVSASGLKMQQLMRQLGLLRIFGSIGLLPMPEAVMGDTMSRAFLYRSYCNQDQISEFMHIAPCPPARKEQVGEGKQT